MTNTIKSHHLSTSISTMAFFCVLAVCNSSRGDVEWKRPALQMDLKPALESLLITTMIGDEGKQVPAKPESFFLKIPLRYDARSGLRSLTRSLIRGRHKRGFYGFQVLEHMEISDQLRIIKESPIYERVQLRNDKNNRDIRFVLVNSQGPRHMEAGEYVQETLRVPAKVRSVTDWVVLIVELPRQAKKLTLHWSDDSESIDLAYLQTANRPLMDPNHLELHSPVMDQTLAQLKKPSAAMAELAVARLTQFRDRIPSENLDRWSAAVDVKIVAAGMRKEDQLRSAAWKYFATYPNISQSILRFLAKSNAEINTQWIELIRTHVDVSNETERITATRLLSATLQSNEEAVCSHALDAIFSLDTPIDWDLLAHASEIALSTLLGRLHLLPPEMAERMILMMMKPVHSSFVAKVAAGAQTMNLRLFDPRVPILTQWKSLQKSGDRLALLTILKSVDLGDLIYSRPYFEMIKDAIGGRDRSKIRQAAYDLTLNQARRRLMKSVAGKDSPKLPSRFPVLVNQAAQDPILWGLTEAATKGPPSVRREAMTLLLHEGFVRRVDSALVSTARKPEVLKSDLEHLLARPDIADSDAMLALLGRLLKPKHVALCQTILRHLDKIAASHSEEHWRLIAALKAGVRFEDLDALVRSLPPSLSKSALRWFHDLGHFSPQERQRLAAKSDPASRLKRLSRINLRHAQLVDGRYGVLAVVETTVYQTERPPPVRQTSGRIIHRWKTPDRRTLTLPPLSLRLDKKGNTYQVLWAGRSIGHGVTRIQSGRGIRSPSAFSPMLREPDAIFLGRHGWGWPATRGSGLVTEAALGPLTLPGNRPVLETPTSDTMTLEISDYLRQGFHDAGLFLGKPLESWVPNPLRLTLRYAAFSAYYGVGVTFPLPDEDIPNGQRHLLNIMLILEKMD